MKISDVIRLLEIAKAKDGDLEVWCWPYDGQNDGSPCEHVEVRNGRVYVEDEL